MPPEAAKPDPWTPTGAVLTAAAVKQSPARLARDWFLAPGVLLVLGIFSWFATYGTFRFFEPESFGQFYDAQASSFLQGRVDVPPESLGAEALVRNGKYYGYFGPTPALLRLPLNLLLPGFDGRWSRFSLLVASLVTLITAYLLILQVENLLGGAASRGAAAGLARLVFIVTAGLGSTNLFLASRSFAYHEASMWAAAFAMLSFYLGMRYLLSPRLPVLACAMACSYLSFFSRITVGAAAVLTLTVLGALLLIGARERRVAGSTETVVRRLQSYFAVPAPPKPVAHGVCLALVATFTVASFVFLNYVKFNTLFENFPARYHIQYSPERISRVQGSLVHPSYFLPLLASYLTSHVEFHKSFPWVYMGRPSAALAGRVDIAEPFAGLPGSMPGLLLLSVLGAWQIWFSRDARFRLLRLSSMGALAGGCVLFTTAAISQRYLHDFYPFLILTGVPGLYWLLGGSNRLLRGTLWGTWLLACLFSVCANLSFAIVYQRDTIWGVAPEVKASFRDFRARVDYLFAYGSKQTEPASLTALGGEETVFLMDPSRKATAIRPLHQVSALAVKDGVILTSTGEDPQTELTPLSLLSDRRYLIELDMTAPGDTVVQFFYGNRSSPGYSERNSIKTRVRKGRNRIVIQLAEPGLHGAVRFDPGMIPGEYRIHCLEVRSRMGR
ncbi:MAG: hypothetical protein AAB403_22655 [Planctomycetota bacterium]